MSDDPILAAIQAARYAAAIMRTAGGPLWGNWQRDPTRESNSPDGRAETYLAEINDDHHMTVFRKNPSEVYDDDDDSDYARAERAYPHPVSMDTPWSYHIHGVGHNDNPYLKFHTPYDDNPHHTGFPDRETAQRAAEAAYQTFAPGGYGPSQPDPDEQQDPFDPRLMGASRRMASDHIPTENFGNNVPGEGDIHIPPDSPHDDWQKRYEGSPTMRWHPPYGETHVKYHIYRGGGGRNPIIWGANHHGTYRGVKTVSSPSGKNRDITMPTYSNGDEPEQLGRFKTPEKAKAAAEEHYRQTYGQPPKHDYDIDSIMNDQPPSSSPKGLGDDEDYSRIFDAVRRALKKAGMALWGRTAAAVHEELLGQLHDQFHDWYNEHGNEKLNWAGRGPLGNWSQIENFLKTHYPEAHKGLTTGKEEAGRLLDTGFLGEGGDHCPSCEGEEFGHFNKSNCTTCNGTGLPDKPLAYETGPDAVDKYGYDPKEIAAGMLLLHNRTHNLRSDMEEGDLDRLSEIARVRSQMQPSRTGGLRRTASHEHVESGQQGRPDWTGCAHPECRPDLPTTMYHVSHPDNRDSIAQHGLLTSHSQDDDFSDELGMPHGIYMTSDEPKTSHDSERWPGDTWAIDTTKLKHLENDFPGGMLFRNAYATKYDVPPEAIRLHRPSAHHRLGGLHARLAARAAPVSDAVLRRIAAELSPPCPDCGQVAGFEEHPMSAALMVCRNCEYPMLDSDIDGLLKQTLGDWDKAISDIPEIDHPGLGKHGQLSYEDTMKLIDDQLAEGEPMDSHKKSLSDLLFVRRNLNLTDLNHPPTH